MFKNLLKRVTRTVRETGHKIFKVKQSKGVNSGVRSKTKPTMNGVPLKKAQKKAVKEAKREAKIMRKEESEKIARYERLPLWMKTIITNITSLYSVTEHSSDEVEWLEYQEGHSGQEIRSSAIQWIALAVKTGQVRNVDEALRVWGKTELMRVKPMEFAISREEIESYL